MFNVRNIKELIHSAVNHKTVLDAKDAYIGVVFHKDYFTEVLNEMILCGFKADILSYVESFGDWYCLLIEDDTFSICHIMKDGKIKALPKGGVWFYHEDAPSKCQTSHEPDAIYVWGFKEEEESSVKDLIDFIFESFLKF